MTNAKHPKKITKVFLYLVGGGGKRGEKVGGEREGNRNAALEILRRT